MILLIVAFIETLIAILVAVLVILVAVSVIILIIWAVDRIGFPDPINWIVKGIGVLVVLVALANNFGYTI